MAGLMGRDVIQRDEVARRGVKEGSAERGAGARLRDATVEPINSASVQLPIPCASPGSDPQRIIGAPLPPSDAPRDFRGSDPKEGASER